MGARGSGPPVTSSSRDTSTAQPQMVTYTMARSSPAATLLAHVILIFKNTKEDKNVLLCFHLQLDTGWERLFPRVSCTHSRLQALMLVLSRYNSASQEALPARAWNIDCVLLGRCGSKRLKVSKETSPVFSSFSAMQIEVVNVMNVKKWRLRWINASRSHSLQV